VRGIRSLALVGRPTCLACCCWLSNSRGGAWVPVCCVSLYILCHLLVAQPVTFSTFFCDAPVILGRACGLPGFFQHRLQHTCSHAVLSRHVLASSLLSRQAACTPTFSLISIVFLWLETFRDRLGSVWGLENYRVGPLIYMSCVVGRSNWWPSS